jgi:hypothetical protein
MSLYVNMQTYEILLHAHILAPAEAELVPPPTPMKLHRTMDR